MGLVIFNWFNGYFANLNRKCVCNGVLSKEREEARAEETKADRFYYVKSEWVLLLAPFKTEIEFPFSCVLETLNLIAIKGLHCERSQHLHTTEYSGSLFLCPVLCPV